MQIFKRYLINSICIFLGSYPLASAAQTQMTGFAVDRLYLSAPGSGWLVMNTLQMSGDLEGLAGIIFNYALNPLKIKNLSVISTEISESVGLAIIKGQYKAYLNLPSPIRVSGDSGTVDNFSYASPNINWGNHPDNISDVCIGFDSRFRGEADSPFRLGGGVQVYIPSGDVSDYITDGTYRFMGRLLGAGDVGNFIYAWQTGVHIRPFNNWPQPPGPQGNEFLLGVAGGLKFPFLDGNKIFVLGFEVYEASAIQTFMNASTTALEWLLSGRLEGANDQEKEVRVKLGIGGGINPQFGAPDFRAVFALELLNHPHPAQNSRAPL